MSIAIHNHQNDSLRTESKRDLPTNSETHVRGAYIRTIDHPFTHRVISACGFCTTSQEDRSSIKQTLYVLVRMHALWLQYQPHTTSDVLNRLLPSACIEAKLEWLLQATGDALWGAGYFPDQALSPDPLWTWGGDL
jgi:hypothetical protein